MKHLPGIRTFQSNIFPSQKDLFARLDGGQNPWACVLACSDSRYTAEMVFNAQAGDLFVIRNAGNMMIPFSEDQKPSESASALEYAISVLNIEDVYVLGHYRCGVVLTALSRPDCMKENPALSFWVEQTRHDVVEAWNTLDPDRQNELHRFACRDHLVHQLDNLRTHPCLIKKPNVRVHGLIFDIKTGCVEEYDRASGLFVPVPAETTS